MVGHSDSSMGLAASPSRPSIEARLASSRIRVFQSSEGGRRRGPPQVEAQIINAVSHTRSRAWSRVLMISSSNDLSSRDHAVAG